MSYVHSIDFIYCIQPFYIQLFLVYYKHIVNNTMENIYLDKVKSMPHKLANVRKVYYQPSSNGLLIVHDLNITKYLYQNRGLQFEHIFTHGPVEELEGNIVMLEEMVEEEEILVALEDGSIFTINKAGQVDVKAQNEDGLTAATVSPSQEYIYLTTKNKSLIQLNQEYDLVNQIPIDEYEQVLNTRAQFSWRADGNFFVLNYETVKGHKAITKDLMMATFISPSKSDPNEDGLVQSVSEKGREKMSVLVAYQPSGSIIAGTDYINENEKKLFRVIFWEKNGLRHLHFNLPHYVSEVLQLFWSYDSTILFIKVRREASIQLLLYYRSNYHWFLKNVVYLQEGDFSLSLSSQKQRSQLLLVQNGKIEVLQFVTRLPQKEWKSEKEEMNFKHQFCYFVDGPLINVTDLSKCLMPPPMSMFKIDFGQNVTGVSKKLHNLLVITKQKLFLYDLIKQSIVDSCVFDQQYRGKLFPDLKLLKNDEIQFSSDLKRYLKKEDHFEYKGEHQGQSQKYLHYSEQHNIELEVVLEGSELFINGNQICQECSSFTLYHEFLLFTVTTSDMYDKLYVLNLTLDDWVYNDDAKVKSKLAETESKDLLNHRLIERGSRIVSVSEGRVVFQLPRGNFEGIYPKVIMINLVKKYIEDKHYKKAFEVIRTHKLDFNLIYDINPEQFTGELENIIKDLKRVDYVNLLISQMTESASTEMQYIMTAKAYDNFRSEFELSLKGKKIKKVCKLISETLRNIGKQDYILSIFTSEIREGKLNDVLFQIKEMKKEEIEVVVPPHLMENKQKKEKKKLSTQQILEYVCWLVDANTIYQAALLTYDLQLAAITARCTQKDPKEYIPYLEGLKEMEDKVEFKAKICLDLKRYEIAVKQLSEGNEEQKERSLNLIKKYKLYKHGLMIYADKHELKNVKEFIIEELLITGDVNEAYRVAQSIGLHQRSLQIAKGAFDSQKIKQALEYIYPTRDERVKVVRTMISDFKDQIKNRNDLAKLYAYVEEYQEAVSLYLKYFDYRSAYQYLWKVRPEFRQKEMREGFKLCFSVKRNQIIKDKKDFLEKYGRLKKVQKNKTEFGQPSSFKARDNDDMYSEVSMTSKAQSSYTMSTTTGMRKKKDKKRSILTRNVKEGSPLEEQYLLAYLKMLEDKVDDAVSTHFSIPEDSKLLIQHLIYMNLIEEAQLMRNEVREYIELFNTYPVKSFAKTRFQESHPQAYELYYEPTKISGLSIDSFNYLF